jgi:hypothetical protein
VHELFIFVFNGLGKTTLTLLRNDVDVGPAFDEGGANLSGVRLDRRQN